MLRLLICFSLVFGQSMQTFAQSGAAKKEYATFENPWATSREDDALERLVAAQSELESARRTYKELENKATDASEEADLTAEKRKLDAMAAQVTELKMQLDHAKDPISCFDLFFEHATSSYAGGIMAGCAFGGLSAFAVGASVAEKVGDGAGVGIGVIAGVAVGAGMYLRGNNSSEKRTLKLATRLNLESCGVDTNPQRRPNLKIKAKPPVDPSKILGYYNKQLSRRGKVVAKASIDDVRAVMVDGFNSGDFCRANAPATNDTVLMSPAQTNAYILPNLKRA